MLKQTITYQDFDENECQETLYFNLTKTELAENLDLNDRVQTIARMLDGETRELQTGEVREILDLVKTFMRLSFGQRSADGKRFVKSDDMWKDFTQTAAYDAFMFSLFESPDKAFGFLNGILPKDLREEAARIANQKNEETGSPQAANAVEGVVEDNRPLYQKENRQPTKAELMAMTKEEMVEAMKGLVK